MLAFRRETAAMHGELRPRSDSSIDRLRRRELVEFRVHVNPALAKCDPQRRHSEVTSVRSCRCAAAAFQGRRRRPASALARDRFGRARYRCRPGRACSTARSSSPSEEMQTRRRSWSEAESGSAQDLPREPLNGTRRAREGSIRRVIAYPRNDQAPARETVASPSRSNSATADAARPSGSSSRGSQSFERQEPAVGCAETWARGVRAVCSAGRA